MGKFKEFLQETEDKLKQINEILAELNEEELDEFGFVLYHELFENETDDDTEYDGFELKDIQEMIAELGSGFYEEILDLLAEYDEDEELDEAVSRRIANKNLNRKKRKFMGNSKADLRKTKTKRKQNARKNRAGRKRYYRANKQKIGAYQKSRAAAIKKGKHKVKKRRTA